MAKRVATASTIGNFHFWSAALGKFMSCSSLAQPSFMQAGHPVFICSINTVSTLRLYLALPPLERLATHTSTLHIENDPIFTPDIKFCSSLAVRPLPHSFRTQSWCHLDRFWPAQLCEVPGQRVKVLRGMDSSARVESICIYMSIYVESSFFIRRAVVVGCRRILQ